MPRVLLVDDDADQLEIRRLLLERAGHQVWAASGVEEARRLSEENRLELVVMDLHLPEAGDGVRLIRHVREALPGVRIVVLSGWTEALVGTPEARMVDHVLRKPVRSGELLRLVAQGGA
ncbi:MAG: response regulator [Bryobacteraceae bacterium]